MYFWLRLEIWGNLDANSLRTVAWIFRKRLGEFYANDDFGLKSVQVFHGQWGKFFPTSKLFFDERRCKFTVNSDANLMQKATEITISWNYLWAAQQLGNVITS